MEDALIFAGGLHHGAGFVNGEGERLFAIDIFARFAGGDGEEGVPVVGRGDDHGINVLPRQQITEVFILGAALEVLDAFDAVKLVHRFAGEHAASGVHIADRDHLGVGHLEEVVGEAAALDASADDAHGDAVVGTFAGNRGRVEEAGGGESRRRGGFEELSPTQLVLHGRQCLALWRRRQTNSSTARRSVRNQPETSRHWVCTPCR